MRTNFFLYDFDELMSNYEEEHGDTLYSTLEQVPVVEIDDVEIYAFGMRIVIPDYHISIREGIEYPKDNIENCYDAIIVYDEDEKDPKKCLAVYANASLSSIVHHYAPSPDDLNPACYYDEDEFILWE